MSGTIGNVAAFLTQNKPTSTTRSATTSVTADPDLQVVLDPSTTYIISAAVGVAVSSSVPGFQFAFAYTGTASEVSITSQGLVDNAAPRVSIQSAFPAVATGFAPTASTTNSVVSVGIIATTTGGTLSFNWGPLVNTADTASVLAGSFLQIRKYTGVVSGFSGFSGVGTSGFSGKSGFSGFSSTSGWSGFSGQQGIDAVSDPFLAALR